MSSDRDKTLREKSEEIDEKFEDIKDSLEEGEMSQRAAVRQLEGLHTQTERVLENYEESQQDTEMAVDNAHSRMDRTLEQYEELEQEIDDLLSDMRTGGSTGGSTRRRVLKKAAGVVGGAALFGLGADYIGSVPGDGNCDHTERAAGDIDGFGYFGEQRSCASVERDGGNGGQNGGTPTTDGGAGAGNQTTTDTPGGTPTGTPTGTPEPTEFEGIYTDTRYNFSEIDHCLSSDQEAIIREEIGDPADMTYLVTADADSDNYVVNVFDDGDENYLGNQVLQCEVRHDGN
ncbi:MAG: hypothetical protein ABEI58_01850 [Candidatus Nanohaloarchaea archaeon]